MALSFHSLKVWHTFITSTHKSWNCYSLGRELQFGRSTIASSLRTLARNGWIEDVPDDNPNKRFRHIYWLTEQGLDEGRERLMALQFSSGFFPSRAPADGQLRPLA